MKKFSWVIAATLSLGLYSCGSNESPKSAATSTSENSTMSAEASPVSAINLQAGDDMKFDATAFTIQAGKEVTLTFKNVGKADKAVMGHNVVILTEGQDPAAYGTEAINAKDQDYLPKKLEAEVVAHTKLLGPGETDEIKFTIPKAGVYPFLCSFPGHEASMNGTITVVE